MKSDQLRAGSEIWNLQVRRLTIVVATLIFIFAPRINTSAELEPNPFNDVKFSINLQNSDLRELLEMISVRTGLRYRIADGVAPKISYAFEAVTLREALEQVTRENGLKYTISDGVIVISALGSSKTGEVAAGSSGGESGFSETHLLTLKYINVTETVKKISDLVEKNEKLLVDEPTNALVLLGSQATRNRIMAYLQKVDIRPAQILIEGQVVEVRKSKIVDLGISFGDLNNAQLNNITNGSFVVNNSLSSNPNLGVKLKLGSIDGRNLELKLAAAENSGDAKIVSRPKVVTINNTAANINSGVTYNVKTLSSTTAGSSGSSSVSGGITSISAGLSLRVLPTIVDSSSIRLKIDVTSSEPDLSAEVDGIPGIVDNSASTNIIVRSGSTAVMAGLIKNSFGKSQSGVPWLSSIPILGWFFKNQREDQKDVELLIFITPTIVGDQVVSLTK